MTAIQPILPKPPEPSPEAAAIAPAKAGHALTEKRLAETWLKIEALLDRVGDRLNPILVKEARQAMKSRQFVVTFSLLLIFGWIWTVLFIAFGIPDIFYQSVGPAVLTGYYVVLSIPLLIVVPYAAFRSLAAEREDGTYELLSITTLSARQIVLGKLGSAVLQMIVYYSALAPCIAFTYLLRGIDVITIGLFLTYLFLASLLLSIFGLMMATVTQSRHWQVLLSVVLVLALLVFGVFWDSLTLSGILNASEIPYDNADFWMANLCGLTFYIPLCVLLLLIAAGQITFASENRSTPIRAVLIIPQMLLTGWFVYYWLRFEAEEEMLYIFTVLAGMYWVFAGAFLSGETAQLSPRAMRKLPQSLAGRMAFTWFNPGSGTGYMFACLNLLALLLLGLSVGLAPVFATGLGDVFHWIFFAICVVGYVWGYLGLARIIVLAARRFIATGMLATFLCNLILMTCGILGPLLLQAMISWMAGSSFDYTYLQLPNWIWTLVEVGRSGTFVAGPAAATIGSTGLVLFLINLVLAAHEVEYVRLAAPQRVLEDEAALHPAPAPAKKSPWD
jgi:hypothetical protein